MADFAGWLWPAAWLAASAPVAAQTQLWVRQFGTPANDVGVRVAADGAGSAYLCGWTGGSLGGPSLGGYDALVTKYDPQGNYLWAAQLATNAYDQSTGVGVNTFGHVYVSGWTGGSLGAANAGNDDLFVAMLETAFGMPIWVRQLGTPAFDQGTGIAVDSTGAAYVCGWTGGSLGAPHAGDSDALVAKYSVSGTLLWARQIGTPVGDACSGICRDDAGHVYVCGWTRGSLGGPVMGDVDAFIALYDTSGNLAWKKQAGTAAHDSYDDVAVDALGHAYVTGYTLGGLWGPSAGGRDVVLAKYDQAGGLVWARQFGAPGDDMGAGIDADSAGACTVTGSTFGSLGGPNAGWSDVFLRSFDTSGLLRWSAQSGSPGLDTAGGVTVVGAGHAYVTGDTNGGFGWPNTGMRDVVLFKYRESCYPDCDENAALTVADFGCFQTKFVVGDPSADCNFNGVLTVADFACFQTKFVTGCP